MRYAGNYQTPFGFALTPWVRRLLIANVAIFLVSLVNLDFFIRWFSFSPSEILVRPWGVVTYMFLHGGLWHLLLNMLVLFFFGPPLESRWGSREFVKFYFIAGLGGVALSFLFAPNPIIGASAAMYGLMVAFALTWPNAPIYIWGIFPVKAKWLVGIFFLLSLVSAFGGGGGGIAHFAHVGGAITGFLYLKREWRPKNKPRTKGREVRVRRLAIVPREEIEEETRAQSGPEWTRRDDAMLDEVDRILDKISAQGMGSLTDDERRVLDEVSRRHRSN